MINWLSHSLSAAVFTYSYTNGENKTAAIATSGTSDIVQLNTWLTESVVIGTQSGKVSGGASFVKNGAGTLLLTAVDNDITGPITLTSGVTSFSGRVSSGTSAGAIGVASTATLAFQNSSTSAAAVTVYNAISNSGSIIVDRSSSTLISGGITGSGTLQKLGTGTLTLTGANIYTGNTTVSAGTLQLGDGTTKNGSVYGKIINNASLVIANPAAQAISYEISGSGGLTKTGTGVLTLSAKNTYQGATVITAGTVRLNTTTLPSDLDIMPLGDSITYGVNGTDAGYRSTLYKLLNPVASSFTFVGSSTRSPGTTLPGTELSHEGHPSYTINNIANNLDGFDQPSANGVNKDSNDGGYWLTGGNGTGRSALDPDIILLMIGTNDVATSSTATLEANLRALLTKITTLRPDAILVVAQIVPLLTSTANNNKATAYNAIVRSVVADYLANGAKISTVDLNTNFPTNGTSSDNVHPNDIGYTFMAGEWYNAVLTNYKGLSEALPAGTDISISAAGTLDINGNQATAGSLSGAGTVTLGTGGQLTISNTVAKSSTFSGVISGSGAFIKDGAGKLTFSGTSIYTGDTTITSGTLAINGRLTASNVHVSSDGTLSGSGLIDKTTFVSGTLAPGDGVGTLSVHNITLDTTAVLKITLNGASQYSQLAIAGTLTLTEGASLSIDLSGFTPSNDEIFHIITGLTGISGSSSKFADGYTFISGGREYQLDYVSNGIDLIAVPEPSTTALAVCGLLLVVMTARRVRSVR